ncbi:MAG TPA: class I SAM-dependent methyltransferase [Acidimicrobiia bacterium]|nr:class I SAM-dependent methyltransferase [Acidimicrobiia bacterium]
MTSTHERRARAFWDADADDYQALHDPQLSEPRVWGVWAIPDDEIDVLGPTASQDVLELGCGAAQWSIALAGEGARCIGLDISVAQLRHARRGRSDADVSVPLVCASGEAVPLQDASFDLVFCDHGAFSFCDPERAVGEAARVLRPGGRLVFNHSTLLHTLCWDIDADRVRRKLRRPYFGAGTYDWGDGTVDFHLTYGEWVACFIRHGLVVEGLVELQPPPDAATTYGGYAPVGWARQWPAEEIWQLRKA